MDGRSALAYLLAALAALALWELTKVAYAWAKRSGRQRLVTVLKHPIFHGLVVTIVGGAILSPPIERWMWGDRGVDAPQREQHAAAKEADKQEQKPNGTELGDDASSLVVGSREGWSVLHGAARELRRLDAGDIGVVLGGTIVRDGVRTANLMRYTIKGAPFGDESSTLLHSTLPRPKLPDYSAGFE